MEGGDIVGVLVVYGEGFGLGFGWRFRFDCG